MAMLRGAHRNCMSAASKDVEMFVRTWTCETSGDSHGGGEFAGALRDAVGISGPPKKGSDGNSANNKRGPSRSVSLAR
jgi:hypothetical protein